MDDFARRMAALDAAEQLLSATNVRGISGRYRTQMDINRLFLKGARSCLDGGGGDDAAAPGDDSPAG